MNQANNNFRQYRKQPVPRRRFPCTKVLIEISRIILPVLDTKNEASMFYRKKRMDHMILKRSLKLAYIGSGAYCFETLYKAGIPVYGTTRFTWSNHFISSKTAESIVNGIQYYKNNAFSNDKR